MGIHIFPAIFSLKKDFFVSNMRKSNGAVSSSAEVN